MSRREHAIPGRRAVAEALRAGRRLQEVLVDSRRRADLDELVASAQQAGVRVRTVDRDALDAAGRGVVHNGVVALAPPFRYARLDELGGHLVVVLDGVTDPQNLGAIARSAEAAGSDGLILRERRSAGVTPAAEKAAAGAFSHLRVALVTNLTRALAELADRGFWSVGLAAEAGQPVWECPLLDGPVALVIGSEGGGLSRLVAERVDALVAIPSPGRLDSLNASAAAAVALFEVVRRRHQAARTTSG